MAIVSVDKKGNTTVLAEFEQRIGIALSLRAYRMNVLSDEIPDIVYFLCIAARDRASLQRKG